MRRSLNISVTVLYATLSCMLASCESTQPNALAAAGAAEIWTLDIVTPRCNGAGVGGETASHRPVKHTFAIHEKTLQGPIQDALFCFDNRKVDMVQTLPDMEDGVRGLFLMPVSSDSNGEYFRLSWACEDMWSSSVLLQRKPDGHWDTLGTFHKDSGGRLTVNYYWHTDRSYTLLRDYKGPPVFKLNEVHAEGDKNSEGAWKEKRTQRTGLLKDHKITWDTSTSNTIANRSAETWTFVSMPDFLNVDTTYPQPGWEDALDYVLKAVKAENPDFVLVAGDLVMGRWWTKEKIDKYAAIYYPAWVKRMNDHGLKFYTAVGDHELGDNPWPPARAKLVPHFKAAFRKYLKMPLNGPDHMKGTAFSFLHKNNLFVAVDVFEKGKSVQGEIAPQVTGKQLEWFNKTLDANPAVDNVIVMGHTPILAPVKRWSSSGLMLLEGRKSALWKSMARRNVDLYLGGEVHAITCTERDGVQQIAHGGLFGYNSRVNYMVVKVSPGKMELELKELDIVCKGPKLWQEGKNRPKESVTITDEIKKRGYVSVGEMTVDKTGAKKVTKDKTGYFDESKNPRK